jgi:uncharacterized protein
MRHGRIPTSLAALAALAGCGHSAPTHLLTIDMAPPAARAPYAGPPLRVTAVQVPPSIDRLEFASALSPTELRIEDQYHWSASLGSLARAALLRDLVARLPASAVLPPDSPAGQGTRRVDVALLALTTQARTTRMEVLVTLATDGAGPVMRRQFTLTRDHAPAQPPAQAAQDYSAMLGDTADQIVAMATQMAAQTPTAPALSPRS